MAKKKSTPVPSDQVSNPNPRKHAFQFRITEKGEANLAQVQAKYGCETGAEAMHVALHIAATTELKPPRKKPNKGVDY